MNICESGIGFQMEGKFAYIIKLDKGCTLTVEELIEQAKHFRRVVLCGKPMEQKEDIIRFIKMLRTKNPNIIVEIVYIASKKPMGLKAADVITVNIDFARFYNAGIIKSFVKEDARFIFSVIDENDIDKVLLFTQHHDIPKSQVYLKGSIKFIIPFAKHYKYNIAFMPEVYDDTEG